MVLGNNVVDALLIGKEVQTKIGGLRKHSNCSYYRVWKRFYFGVIQLTFAV